MKEIIKSMVCRTWFFTVVMLCAAGVYGFAADSVPARIPVIFDTDIGGDIDDTWALVMLLRSPELDVKLITTTFGQAEYRTKIIAKLLTIAGRTDIPIGMGTGVREEKKNQEAWVKNYDLKSYAGKIHQNGVQAMIDVINASPQPVSLISVGPSFTIADMVTRQPEIAAKAIFVGMQGSVRKGYNGGAISPECNVVNNVPGAKKALLAPWKQTIITPLDTCGLVRLKGEKFQKLRDSQDVLIKALMENYRIWAKKTKVDELKASSVLFDTVAVYLAYPGAKSLVTMEELSIGVTDDGFTKIDPAGAKMTVATDWKDLNEFENFLIKRLLK